MRPRLLICLAGATLLAASVIPAGIALGGGGIVESRRVVASGGGSSAAGSTSAKGTVGQAVAGTTSGGVEGTIGFWHVGNPIVDAPEEAPSAVVRDALHPNHPNPFNPKTTIRFSLEADSDVVLRVLDVTGRQVARLVDARLDAGAHRIEFAPRNLASGVYFYRLTTPHFEETRRMTLLK